MLEKLNQTSGNILGYKVIGKITGEDYKTVTDDLEALGQDEDSICLLLDLEAFEGEEIKALSAKTRFRGDYQKKITKMAIVGEMNWHKWYLSFADRLNYDRETEFFPAGDHQAALEWARA